ncbi:MAG TPA: cation:proton antiporter [Vicinamibacterales bacterium]|nr:cation:proton antiporter [Vicinamibacterales bacterium]
MIVIALVLQVSLDRVDIPAVVGLLVAGMLLGPGGLVVVPEEPVVDLLGSIGLVYIMFVAGLEIDLEIVRHQKQESAAFGLLAFWFSLVPGVGVGILLGQNLIGAFLIGAAVSSHTLLAYPILQRLGLQHERPVVAAIGGTLLTDTMALVLLAVIMQRAGGSAGWLGWAGPILMLGALVAVSVVVVPRLAASFLQHARVRLAQKALFLLAILLVLTAAAEMIGTEEILGAFLAGVCLNRSVQQRPEVREHVEFIGRMLFIPFFFVQTGMRLELAVFAGGGGPWTAASLMLGVILFAKFAAAWSAGAIFRYPIAARVTMGALALPQAAATLAVVVTAREAGLLDREVVDATVIVIFVTCLAGPLLTRFAGARAAAWRPPAAVSR